MALTKEQKEKIIKVCKTRRWHRSPEVQIALLTKEIEL